MILHLGKYYPPAAGGIEAHVQTLARGQVALGRDVTVLCVNHALPDGTDATWSTVTRTRTSEEHDAGVRVSRLGRLGSFARLDLTPRVLGALRRHAARASVIHLHVPNPLMMIALSAIPSSVPIVVTWHSDVVKQRLRGLLLHPIEEALLRRAALILSDSEGYIGGSPPLLRHRGKVEVLPLGLDLRPYAHPSASVLDDADRLRREHGSPLWLAVGRLVYYKGLHSAIDALEHVPGRLLVVGTGPEGQRLRARAQARGVADRVKWLGHVRPEALEAAYHAATALWFPSNARSEGFGQVQIEAMASGCPVINTSIPDSGAAWVSLDGVSGLTVPMEDPLALAGAARRLLDPAVREKLAEGARHRASSEFDQALMARRCLDLYDVASERARASAPA